MSTFDQAWLIVKKYLVPVIFGVFALFALLATEAEQNTFYYVGFGSLLAASIVAIALIAGIIPKPARLGLSVVFVGAVGYLLYANVHSVQSEIARLEKIKLVRNEVIQGLEDVRDVQVAYHEKYGRYCESISLLRRFLAEDSVAKVYKEGVVPDDPETFMTIEDANNIGLDVIPTRLTEYQACLLGELGVIHFVRDTSYAGVVDHVFEAKDQEVKEKRAFAFNFDTFGKVPHNKSGDDFWMATAVAKKNEIDVSCFQAKDPDPFVAKDTLIIGSLVDNKTNGNWAK